MTHADLSELDTGLWPERRTAVLDWLVRETMGERYLDNIFVALCKRLVAAGLPIARAGMYLETNHPQWLGVRIRWWPGLDEAEIHGVDYGVGDTAAFLKSPARTIREGAEEVRGRFHATDPADDPYPLFGELRAEGLTDYVAWPFPFTLGKRHFITFATDRPGGFREDELRGLAELLPVLAPTIEVRLKNRFARLLLDTYVGPHAGEAILAGATRRGTGFTVAAAIVVVDLRDFTSISDLWPRDDVIALLNDYFDALSEPIERHGGEILKFMGDGLLAIFPEDPKGALGAVKGIQEAMAALNVRRAEGGLGRLGYGVGVNYGDVMYGNIGSKTRLDFTVIGPAVNVASRLETLTKEMDANALFSAAFVAKVQCRAALRPVGTFPIRGLSEPVEVFAFRDEPA